MANKIILKKSSVASKVPVPGDLEVGEIAVNLADAKLYSKNAGGTVIELAAAGSGDVVGPASATDNTIVRFDGTTGKLVQGSGIAVDDSNNIAGVDALLTRVMLQDTGWGWFDQADTNTAGTATLNYTNDSVQRWSPTGTRTLAVSNWPPSGNLGELLVEGVNLGAATITWPTVNWIKSDGTTTTTFASNGVTLQSSGTDWFLLWTRDGGTTVYGKFVR